MKIRFEKVFENVFENVFEYVFENVFENVFESIWYIIKYTYQIQIRSISENQIPIQIQIHSSVFANTNTYLYPGLDVGYVLR